MGARSILTNFQKFFGHLIGICMCHIIGLISKSHVQVQISVLVSGYHLKSESFGMIMVEGEEVVVNVKALSDHKCVRIGYFLGTLSMKSYDVLDPEINW